MDRLDDPVELVWTFVRNVISLVGGDLGRTSTTFGHSGLAVASVNSKTQLLGISLRVAYFFAYAYNFSTFTLLL